MKKKILIINTTYYRGGAAEVAQEIFNYSNKKNKADVYFAYGRGKKVRQKNLFKFTFPIEIFIHVFVVRFLGLEGYGSYFSTKRLIKFIEKEKFDLIHFHNLHGYYLNFFQLAKFIQEKNIPVVWTLHDEWAITSLLAYSMDCSHCLTGKGKCTNLYSYPKTYNKFFLKFMLNKKQTIFESFKKLIIICPSYWLTERIKKSYLGKFKIYTIYNGVDIKLFKPIPDKEKLRKKYNLPLNKKIVSFSITNLKNKIKGGDYLIKIMKGFLNKINVIFLCVGDKKIKEKNLINFGYISDKQKLNEFYNLSDVFLYSSLAEIFPLIPIEAMACGLPVVAFEIGPLKEIINDNYDGFLVKNINEKSLLDTVNILLENDDLRKQIGYNAAQKIVKNFSLEKMLNNYENIYNYSEL